MAEELMISRLSWDWRKEQNAKAAKYLPTNFVECMKPCCYSTTKCG